MSRTWNAAEQARHQQRWKKQLPWAKAYRFRMQKALERCRHCGALHADDRPLTLAHLVSHADGGALTPWNVTILCGPCNVAQDREVWPHLISLAEEEANASAERRWYEIANQLVRSRMATCPVCLSGTRCDERGKLIGHGEPGEERCPGSWSKVLPTWVPDPAVFGVP